MSGGLSSGIYLLLGLMRSIPRLLHRTLRSLSLLTRTTSDSISVQSFNIFFSYSLTVELCSLLSLMFEEKALEDVYVLSEMFSPISRLWMID